MTSAVVHGDGSWADLEQLSPDDRSAIDDVLIAWLDTGPPRDRPRSLAGVTLFEHHLPHIALAITYFVDDHQQLVGVLRISNL
ncbi:MAG: hypothetical protein M3083_02965 [Actinomycetota bacterium]|nr:hypothetical protein [Actinomycetota bacterium]